MRILAFPGRLNSKAKAPVQDWSTQEIADFYRAHRLLAENGAGIGIDRGVSDEGEPWMVFFDSTSQDVFLHIARIDDVCHLVCEPFSLRLDATDIAALIAQFEHAVRDLMAIRTDRAKNVVVHPAARIIMSISAVFLLFKLENGEAYAKGLTEKATLPASDTRTTEKSTLALARAQAAFQRAFDTMDAPANAALLAGIILASELALKPLQQTADEAHHEHPVALMLEDLHPLHKANGLSVEPGMFVAPVPKVVPVGEVRLPELVTPAIDIVAGPPVLRFTPPDSIVHFPLADQVEPIGQVTEATVVLPVAKVVASQTGVSLGESDAVDALTYLFGLLPSISEQEESAETDSGSPKTIDISLERLEEITGSFGFVSRFHLTDSQLYQLIEHYSSQMGGYNFEYQSGQVLIEQIGAETMRESDLGMFTNVMSDGSTYTIIGQANLIDDVLTLFG